ncbi:MULTISPECIES: hypothetical protein [Streptomyces]|uniref:Uncharacterized protein n=1 Tax=Streptomyces viridochromogenes TaxID=1938 RepID=A0A0L8J1A6_STRVR|nr:MULTISPECIES: hypothetical protein [Streptomyces]KOG07149.1 hypothetical protein ADK34_40730 [Streptomyces viridochromogenes]
MSQNDESQHEGFEEELGAVLRRTGDGFSADDRRELVAGGLQRGRRRLVRRRLAVTGGALALAAVGIGGVYGGSLVGPGGKATTTSVAAAPKPGNATGTADPKRPEQAQIPVKDLAAVLKAHTPAGTWEIDDLDAKGQSVGGVYDDGHGKAAVSVGLYRVGRTAESGEDQVACPDKAVVAFDRCISGRVPNGDRLMAIQGYVYPDKREETKYWRVVLLTKDGFLIDVNEYNAAAEKGAPISRENPPFTMSQLKALVTTDDWRPLLKQLPQVPATQLAPGKAAQPPAEPVGDSVQATLRTLLPKGLRVVDKGGSGEFGFLVVDDGKGKSLVQINVQSDMRDVADDLYGSGDVTTLPDGRKVKLIQQPGEKGGAGVVWWTADTMTPEGFRVVVSAFNTGAQHEAATRAEPALTLDQLKAIALDPKWQKLPRK